MIPAVLKYEPLPHWKRYEYIPYRVGGVIRVWKKKSQPFFKVLLKDIGKLIKLIVRSYRKELVVGSVLLMGLFPSPQHVKAEAPPAPTYIKPIAHLQPVVAISVVVPPEATPVPEPQPVVPPPAPTPTPIVNDAPSSCGDNQYANYIYMHESGCSTTITNSIGCLGIGQACPASKLLAVCPNMDYACENQFFTNYANSVYGGWAGAYQKWINSHWW